MINKEKTEYYGRIGAFIGEEVKLGNAWKTQDPFPMPTGEVINCITITGFKERAKCNNVDCVKIEYAYNSDSQKLNKFS